MEHRIRFLSSRAGRIAYATVGGGPALVLPAWWVGHLEMHWESPPFRRFIEALAGHHTVVHYDPLGTGLSDRHRGAEQFSLDSEVEVLEDLLVALGVERCTLFGFSSGGPVAATYAASHPAQVNRLVLYGTYADGSRIADPKTRQTLPAVAREHWGLGSRLLAAVFLPDASADDLRWFADLQRAAATPEMASQMLALAYEFEAAAALRAVTAPTLVLHRRHDRAIPYHLGLEVAGLVPGAQFRSLDGALHVPWLGDTAALLAAVAEFMGLGPYELAGAAGEVRTPAEPLTARELEVLALVAQGLSDREIGERLVLSHHTVHRHVANIRTKLGQPSRAAAAAAAARLGLI